MPQLYRCMRKENGVPQACTTSKWCLGVKIGDDEYDDIDVQQDGLLHPASGGMSVSPDSPQYLPTHRRPPYCDGGTSRHPLWVIASDTVVAPVNYRPDDPDDDGQQEALRGTQDHWQEMPAPEVQAP